MTKIFPNASEYKILDDMIEKAGASIDRDYNGQLGILFGHSVSWAVPYGDSFAEFADNCEQCAVAIRKDPYVFDDGDGFWGDDGVYSEVVAEDVANKLDQIADNVREKVSEISVA